MPPLYSIVGRSGAGKTTYLEKLLPALKRRGLRVAVIKHDAGGFEVDHPGKDTWRHAAAGADVVAISGPGRHAIIDRHAGETPLDALVGRLGDVDLVLTEGFKRDGRNRIELIRAAHGSGPVMRTEELIGVVSDCEAHPGLPRFPLDDAEPLADFIEAQIAGTDAPAGPANGTGSA